MNVARPAGVGLALLSALIMASLDPAPALAEKLRLEPLTFGDLAGWAQDDHAAAFATFLESCRANTAGTAPLRPAQAPNGDLARVCRSALSQNIASADEARAFLRSAFSADAGRSRQREMAS